ncbi:MAG: rod shape-determining protein MreC [Patescibacteria group bacterium]
MILANKKSITIIVATIFIIILYYAGVLSMLENLLITIIKPTQQVVLEGGTKIQVFYDQTTDRRDLYTINKQLEAENNELLIENASLKILEDENKTLRNQLEFYSQYDYNKVLAYVVSREEGLESSRVITINKGREDGVKEGHAILASNGLMIGKIFKVNDKISFGRLLADKQSQIAVAVAGRENAHGLLYGELGLTALMNFIPQEESIKINDLIITSGLEATIPKGLLLGKVQKIQQKNSDLFQTAVIEPLVNVNSLNIVSVLLY